MRRMLDQVLSVDTAGQQQLHNKQAMMVMAMMTCRIGQATTDQMHAMCHAMPFHAVLCWVELRFPAGLSSCDHADWSVSSDPTSLLVPTPQMWSQC